MRKKILCALVLVLAFAGSVSAAAKQDVRAQRIQQLFRTHNPKLEAQTAQTYTGHVMEAASKYKQDPYVIAAIIVHESTVNNKAVSKGGDYGLMQVRYRVHEKAIKKEYPKVKKAADMFDPRTNIFFGTRILSECAAKSKDLRGALMRYSGNGTKLTAKVLNTVEQLKAGKIQKTTNQTTTTKKKKKNFFQRLFNW